MAEVATSILMKVQDDSALRAQVAREESEQIGNTALAIHERLQRGGKLIIFGNGGSATDANDLAIDCVLPPLGFLRFPRFPWLWSRPTSRLWPTILEPMPFFCAN